MAPSPLQQGPPECHLGHQGKPARQRGQEHPEYPRCELRHAGTFQTSVLTHKAWLAFGPPPVSIMAAPGACPGQYWRPLPASGL